MVRRCLEPKALKVKAGLSGVERRCPQELGVGLDWRAVEGDQGSVSSAGGSQQTRSTSRAN